MNEGRDDGRTKRHRGEGFDPTRERTVNRWGEEIYRACRHDPWGGCRSGALRAYHPGLLRRTQHLLRRRA